MTDIQFKATLTTKGERYTYPLLPRNQVTELERMLQIAPIPAYFIYDGFETDLDATLVYERIICHCTGEIDMITHLKRFLRSCVTAHNAGDAKPYVDTAALSSAPSTNARMWAKEHFKICLPTLCTAPAPSVSTPDRILAKTTGSPLLVFDLTSESPGQEKKNYNQNSMLSSELRDKLICVANSVVVTLPFYQCGCKIVL